METKIIDYTTLISKNIQDELLFNNINCVSINCSLGIKFTLIKDNFSISKFYNENTTDKIIFFRISEFVASMINELNKDIYTYKRCSYIKSCSKINRNCQKCNLFTHKKMSDNSHFDIFLKTWDGTSANM